MTTAQNRQALHHAMTRLAEGDSTAFVDLMAEDFSWTIAGVATPWARTWSGKTAVRRDLFGPLFAQFAEPYRNRPLSLTAEEDRVVVECRGSVSTTAGERYDNHYCYVCRFDAEGRLAALTEYADTALMDAVLEPPPAVAA